MFDLLKIVITSLIFWQSQANNCRTSWDVNPDRGTSNPYPEKYDSVKSCLNKCLNWDSCFGVTVHGADNNGSILCSIILFKNYDFKTIRSDGETTFIKICADQQIPYPSNEFKSTPSCSEYVQRSSLDSVGPPGPPGMPGRPGAPGATGTIGEPGLPGPMGQPGATGPTGGKGAMGDTGHRGYPTAKGVPGQPGEPGDTGFTGAKGKLGAKGPTGSNRIVRRERELVKGKKLNSHRTKRAVDDIADYKDYCIISWEFNNSSDYRDAYKVSVANSENGCIDVCKNDIDCIGVDILCTFDSKCACWLHNSTFSTTLMTSIQYDSWVKSQKCSHQSPVRGPPGFTGPPGQPGLPGRMGLKGAPGLAGFTGFTGIVGSQGATGKKGHTGGSGQRGATGSGGEKGQTGYVGEPGSPGSTGSQGPADFQRRKRSLDENEPSIRDRKDYFVVEWRKIESVSFANFNAFTVEQSLRDCIDKCRDQNACKAVEVEKIPTNDADLFTCFYFEDCNDFKTPLVNSGSITYFKEVTSYNNFPSVGLQGPTGPPGVMGPPGMYGPPGSTGRTGNIGNIGSPGSPGEAGYTGFTGWRGPMSDTGDQGETGPTGATGDRGYTGNTGPTGDIGHFNQK